jgi:hypothetical protein
MRHFQIVYQTGIFGQIVLNNLSKPMSREHYFLYTVIFFICLGIKNLIKVFIFASSSFLAIKHISYCCNYRTDIFLSI